MDIGTLVGSLVGLATIVGAIIGWLHRQIGSNRELLFDHMGKLESKLRSTIDGVDSDHKLLDKLIAKEYMTTDKTMKMYDMMAKAQDQRMADMDRKLNEIDTKLDTLLLSKAGNDK